MSWSIFVEDNTVVITPECAADLFEVNEQEGLEIWYSVEGVQWQGELQFNPDHMEGMDFVWNDSIQAVLLKHKVNGDITFGSGEGDNAGSYWGYRFNDGICTKLVGVVTYQPVKD